MLTASVAGVALIAVGSRSWVVLRASSRVVRVSKVGDRPGRAPTPAPVAAVLGAGLRADGSPTGLLARRVDAGVALYRAGLVERLVMSGAVQGQLDQPAAMARYAISQGVPADDIDLDPDGVNTAATCRQLVARLSAGGRTTMPVAMLVTQEFHIHRAVYLARKAGIDVIGYASSDAEIRALPLAIARVREVPAAVKAIFVDRF